MFYDYIIVGSGPAGSTVAYCLQKQKANCLILEAALQKNEKVCGGYLTWSGIELLHRIGLSPEHLLNYGANRLASLTIQRNGKIQTYRYHCGEYGIGIERRLLDQWLLDCAVSAGATILFGKKVQKFDTDANCVRICGHTGKYLIFATGSRGFVDASTRDLIKKQSIGISAHICGVSKFFSNSVYFWFINQLHDYFWAIPIGRNIWNVGIWFQTRPEDQPIRLFYKYMRQLIDPAFHSYTYRIKPRSAFCGNVDLSVNLPPNCFGIGDFAGCSVATSGEGLRYAIESAIQFAHQHKKSDHKSLWLNI